MGVYRSRDPDGPAARFIDAGIGIIIGTLIALVLWLITLFVWAEYF